MICFISFGPFEIFAPFRPRTRQGRGGVENQKNRGKEKKERKKEHPFTPKHADESKTLCCCCVPTPPLFVTMITLTNGQISCVYARVPSTPLLTVGSSLSFNAVLHNPRVDLDLLKRDSLLGVKDKKLAIQVSQTAYSYRARSEIDE